MGVLIGDIVLKPVNVVLKTAVAASILQACFEAGLWFGDWLGP